MGLLAAGALAVTPAKLVVEGVVPAGDRAPTGVSLRQAALRQGLARAVAQVGRELVEADRRGPAPPELDVLAALGGAPADYTVRYRVRVDHGERTAEVLTDPGVTTEYALEIEVQVDVQRVARGLASAGWLSTLPDEVPSTAHRVVVETSDWGAYAAFVEQLRGPGEARLAVPERFEAGRVLLRVEAPGRPDQLLDRLTSDPESPLEVIRLPGDESELRVQVRLRAAPASLAPREPGAGAIDTESVNRY